MGMVGGKHQPWVRYGIVGGKHQLWVRYGWWQTPTMGKSLKWFAFFANFFIPRVILRFPRLKPRAM